MPTRKNPARQFVCNHHRFCSFECMAAFNENDTRWRGLSAVGETASLIAEMARASCKEPAGPVVAAKHWSLLRMFGGTMSIDDFRRASTDRSRLCIVNQAPMVLHPVSVTEVPMNDMVEKKYSFVPIDDDRINRFKSALRLQRDKPVLRNNSLHNAMNLTTTTR
jgi:hypothetical protein